MMTFLKRAIFISIGLAIIVSLGIYFIRLNTKKHSPEEIVNHNVKQTTFTVFYNRPFKKNREIFGNLVPYNQVWRTGANEATTFTVNKDIQIDGSYLKAGTYTLWTIPNAKSWKIIFNSKKYSWGVNRDGSVKRDPSFDALKIQVPTHTLPKVIEQFSIYFENANEFTIMYLAWDTTSVAIPIKT